MSNIDKQALIAKIKNQTSSFDTVVLREDEANALLDELEAKDGRIEEQAGIIAKQEKWIKDVEETMISATDRAEAAEKRIAELQALARGVKQYSEFQICHYGATEDYAKGYIDCQNNYNKVLFAAAGKGE